MAGVGIVIDPEFARLADRLERLARAETDALLDLVGSEVESQTRRRIESEKTDPGGTEWADWSEGYKSTRHDGQSYLEGEGDLLDSISYEVDDGAVIVGTNLIYGRVHQLGLDDTLDVSAHRRKVKSRDKKGVASGVGFVRSHKRTVNIPAREYLGLSSDNEADVLAIADQWLDDQILGAA